MTISRNVLIVLAVAIVAGLAIAGYAARQSPVNAAQNCDDWADATSERISIARQLIYPVERQGQSTGSVEGDAQALYDLAQEQSNSEPPEEANNLDGDLIEALSAASLALQGGGGAQPEAQMALAKAIIYNADLRIAYLVDGC